MNTIYENIVNVFLQHGILGILLLLSIWYGYKTTRALNKALSMNTEKVQEISNQRIDDTKATLGQLMDLSDGWKTTISRQVSSTKMQVEALREIKVVMEKVRDTMAGCHNLQNGGA
jgi:allantoicase